MIAMSSYRRQFNNDESIQAHFIMHSYFIDWTVCEILYLRLSLILYSPLYDRSRSKMERSSVNIEGRYLWVTAVQNYTSHIKSITRSLPNGHLTTDILDSMTQKAGEREMLPL